MPICTVCGRIYLHKSGLSRHMRMHKEEQPVSTCDRCGKVFDRKDNIRNHLQHCTDHRPPQLPQQPQQHTTAPPATFTISHHYTSMGGAVKRFNIDMQETQHLDHLSPALHLLLPSMKTFQIKHHAYKFQVAITIVCHKAVDPSAVTQPPVTLTSDCCVCRCCTTTRRRQLAATKFRTGIRIERTGWVFPHFQDL